MKYIPSYCTKRNNSMLCRITWNAFFVHWVARGKYRLILHFASCNSKPSPPARLCQHGTRWDPWRDGPFPAILQVMWQLDPLWLANWPRFIGTAELQQIPRESTNRIEFLHLWGIDKLIFWSHYIFKQLIGRLLLCSVRHIMVNCLWHVWNADCWKVSPLSGPWRDLCFVNTGASHMESRKLGKPIDYSSGMCMGNLNSQNALHVDSAKQLFITIFIPVVEHTPTLRHSMFLFIFLVYLPFFSYGQTDFLQFAVNEVASMAAILVQKCFFFFSKKKNPWLQRIPVCAKSSHLHF